MWRLQEIAALIVLILIMSCVIWYVRRDNKVLIHDSGTYKVYEIYDILTPKECRSVMTLAKAKGMQESMVWGYGESNGNHLDASHRKSKQAWLKDDDGDVVVKMSRFTAEVTGFPMSHQESLQVAMYEHQGKFNEHYDACVDTDPASCEKMNKGAGERRATLLVYLNTDFEGGETEFVNLGLRIKPEVGKGILFWSTDDNEVIIHESKHRGNPVRNGEKWICTKWVHQKEYKA